MKVVLEQSDLCKMKAKIRIESFQLGHVAAAWRLTATFKALQGWIYTLGGQS